MKLESVLDVRELKPRYCLFFIANDETRNVTVEEAEEIDVDKIRLHLVRGESVFITNRIKPRLNVSKSKKRIRLMPTLRKNSGAASGGSGPTLHYFAHI